MHTLFGSKFSGSTAIEAALERCGVPFQCVEAATWRPESDLAALVQANPMQQVPTLRCPDGAVLTESAAILIHLGLAHRASGLLPDDAAARAQHLRGLVFIAANCYAAIGVIDYPERWTSDRSEPSLAALRAGAKARLHHCWLQFADSHGAALAAPGTAPSALDMLAVVVSRWSGARAHLRERRPGCAAALDGAEKHADLAAVMTRNFPATPPADAP